MSWPAGIVIFLAAITIASYIALRKRSGEKLTQAYLLSIAIKFLLSGGFVVWFIRADQEAANYNVVLFLVTYLIFTALEVVFLLLKKRA